jgi:hypothetical protein
MSYRIEKHAGHAVITLTSEVDNGSRPSGRFIVYAGDGPHVLQLHEHGATFTLDERIRVRAVASPARRFS